MPTVRLNGFGELAPGGPPAEFRIFPQGTFRTTKGAFYFDEESAKSVAADVEDWANDYSIDYEHAAVLTVGDSPAAGWFKPQVREGELWATGVQWTENASRRLTAREYRYFSPTFEADRKTGRVLRLINLALTNIPATKAMRPLVASRNPHQKESSMPEIKKPAILALLGVDADASENAVRTAIATLHAADNAREQVAVTLAALKGEVAELLTLTGAPTVSEAVGVVQAWKVAHDGAVKLTADKAALEAQVRDREATELVDAGVRDGKIPPAMKEFWLADAKKDPSRLRGFLSAMPVIAPAPAPASPAPAAPLAVSVDEAEQQKIIATTGISPDQVAKVRAQFAEQSRQVGHLIPQGPRA